MAEANHRSPSMIVGITFAALGLVFVVGAAAFCICQLRTSIGTRWHSTPTGEKTDVEKASGTNEHGGEGQPTESSPAKDTKDDVLRWIPAVEITAASFHSNSGSDIERPGIQDETRLSPTKQLFTATQNGVPRPDRFVRFEPVPASRSDATGRWYFTY